MSSYDWISVVYDQATFVAFDTETTGLRPDENKVVEIGAVKFNKEGIISRFSVLINPEMHMPEEASAVNHITDDMLKGQPIFKDVARDFLRFIQNSILVAHNASFDINFINTELKNCKIGHLTNKVVDTLIFAREVFPRLDSYKLQDLAKKFEIVAFEAHRAEDDSRVCMEFFNKAVSHFIEANQEMIPHWKSQTNIEDYLKTEMPETEIDGFAQNLF
ncbi:MAG: 3'-5' exonuclease [Treponema sp.]